MRNEVLKLLQDQESLQKKVLYNALISAYAQTAPLKNVYHYQLGYSPSKLEGLIYEVKKHFHISDKEIILFKGEIDDNQDKGNDGADLRSDQSDGSSPDEKDAAELKRKNDLLAALKLPEHPEVLEGMKIREEYPFLNEANTPDEIKALVTDKITAYKQYAGVVGEIISAENLEESEEKLYELAKEALATYEINQDIKKELDFYRDSNGRILGKHPKLEDLKMQQDVNDMSEADLVKNRANAQKNVSKNTNQNKLQLAEYWKKRLEYIEKRLTKEFNHNFTK